MSIHNDSFELFFHGEPFAMAVGVDTTLPTEVVAVPPKQVHEYFTAPFEEDPLATIGVLAFLAASTGILRAVKNLPSKSLDDK